MVLRCSGQQSSQLTHFQEMTGWNSGVFKRANFTTHLLSQNANTKHTNKLGGKMNTNMRTGYKFYLSPWFFSYDSTTFLITCRAVILGFWPASLHLAANECLKVLTYDASGDQLTDYHGPMIMGYAAGPSVIGAGPWNNTFQSRFLRIKCVLLVLNSVLGFFRSKDWVMRSGAVGWEPIDTM